MDLLSFLIALSSILLGAITIYLNHRERVSERTSAYREALYTKQVDAVSQLFASLQQTSTSSEALRAAMAQDDRRVVEHFSAELEKLFTDTFLLLGRLGPFLANNVMNAATEYLGYFQKLNELTEARQNVSLHSLMDDIRKAEIRLIMESRQMLGTDALSAETMNLFLKHGAPDVEKILQAYSNGYKSEFSGT